MGSAHFGHNCTFCIHNDDIETIQELMLIAATLNKTIYLDQYENEVFRMNFLFTARKFIDSGNGLYYGKTGRVKIMAGGHICNFFNRLYSRCTRFCNYNANTQLHTHVGMRLCVC